jgi:hypothetical protein
MMYGFGRDLAVDPVVVEGSELLACVPLAFALVSAQRPGEASKRVLQAAHDIEGDREIASEWKIELRVTIVPRVADLMVAVLMMVKEGCWERLLLIASLGLELALFASWVGHLAVVVRSLAVFVRHCLLGDEARPDLVCFVGIGKDEDSPYFAPAGPRH